MSHPCVGIVGGLGVEATIHYYSAITKACREQGRAPRLLVNHADMDRGLAYVCAGEIDKLAQYLADLIDELAAAGADSGVLPAITPHICIAELARRVHVPMINVMDVISAALRGRGLKRMAAFGTRYTVESDLFGQLPDIAFVRPKPNEIDEIHDSYFTIVDTGRLDAARIAGLRAIAQRLSRQEGAEAIVRRLMA